jgi:hypothetical protein
MPFDCTRGMPHPSPRSAAFAPLLERDRRARISPPALPSRRARPRRRGPLTVAAALFAATGAAADPPPGDRPPRPADVERVRRVAAAACAAATPPLDAREDAARRARARWAPALPGVAVRAHLGDGGFRRLDGETLVTGETVTASRSVEVRLSWSLDELVYRTDELALVRFEAERRAQIDRQRSQCGELAAKWVRARLDPDRDGAEEQAAYTALDIATAGALAREESARRAHAPERSP